MTETREPYRIAGQHPESYLSYQDFSGDLYDALFRASLSISNKADADLLANEIRRLRAQEKIVSDAK